eukprot:CAMPEP_0174730690 /NCGR_PEP_ID=MMETSP1094-20130205/56104_1 /TAXON_ID=156173 /ORGANISM="Chrysochromulina brevifilum, Strain UTEX LB 985" /LENGTH=138 /DNA_ID=CAMNT_0015932977 /DNA_START=1 /DNA_END=417 /DNA_ORIENTATION=-
MAAPFHGLLNYHDFALQIREVDTITNLEASMRSLLEGVGIRFRTRRSSSNATLRDRTSLHFPTARSETALGLKARLSAMWRTRTAALWQWPANELLANLTLASAWELATDARGRKAGHQKTYTGSPAHNARGSRNSQK